MSIQIHSNLDEEMEKAEKLLNIYSMINKIQEKEEYLTTEDVAKKMGMSIVSAREYMNRPDFPRLECGKGMKVHSFALTLYNLERREKA